MICFDAVVMNCASLIGFPLVAFGFRSVMSRFRKPLRDATRWAGRFRLRAGVVVALRRSVNDRRRNKRPSTEREQRMRAGVHPNGDAIPTAMPRRACINYGAVDRRCRASRTVKTHPCPGTSRTSRSPPFAHGEIALGGGRRP
jgi:hypothetical protein